MTGPAVNIAWLPAEGATRSGDAPALITGDRINGCPQLLGRVARLAAGLRRLVCAACGRRP